MIISVFPKPRKKRKSWCSHERERPVLCLAGATSARARKKKVRDARDHYLDPNRDYYCCICRAHLLQPLFFCLFLTRKDDLLHLLLQGQHLLNFKTALHWLPFFRNEVSDAALRRLEKRPKYIRVERHIPSSLFLSGIRHDREITRWEIYRRVYL